MASRPIVEADIVFLTAAEGGRQNPASVGYRPHLVIQDRTVRHSTVGENGYSDEEYLGVLFVHWPENYANGATGRFSMELWYHPRVDYSKVIPGATFTVREGGRIVGHGVIRSRQNS